MMTSEQSGQRYGAHRAASPSSSLGGRANPTVADVPIAPLTSNSSSSGGGGQVCKFMYSCDVPLYQSLTVCGVMHNMSEATMWCNVTMELIVDGKVVCTRSTYGAPLQTVSTPAEVQECWLAAHTQPRRDELTLGTTYPIRELPSTATIVLTVYRVSHHFECVGKCVLPVFTEARGVLRQGRRIMQLQGGGGRASGEEGSGTLSTGQWDILKRYHAYASVIAAAPDESISLIENSNNRIFQEEGNDGVKEALVADYEAECAARGIGTIPSPPPDEAVIHALSQSGQRYIIVELNPRTEAPVLYSSVRPKEPVRTTLLTAAASSKRLPTIPAQTNVPWILAPADGINAVPRPTAVDGVVDGVEPKTAQMLAIQSSGLLNGASFVHFMPVVDYEAHRIHPSAIKADKLSRKYTSKLPHLPKGQGNVAAAIAAAPRPSAEENRALTRLVRLPVISQPLTLGQKHLLLRYCWGLSKQPEALQRVMQAVDWNDPEEVTEAQSLLDAWAPLGFDDALCLLTPTPAAPVETPGAVAILRPPPPPVWYYAVSRLEATSTDDATLSLYLLQLTLALRYEKPSMAPTVVGSDTSDNDAKQQRQQHTGGEQDTAGG
ncbi:Phosphatidylinositol 3-kinase catalytic subunit type 3, partial [Perkinsus olseni]